MKNILTVVLVAAVSLSLALFGCKGKVEKVEEEQVMETAFSPVPTQDVTNAPLVEPAETVATETIPPTASPQITEKPAIAKVDLTREKDIQTALKNAGYYTGPIDGKIGPKSKKAIEDFQRDKGLKVDGKVGPKTWAELEKYLTKQ